MDPCINKWPQVIDDEFITEKLIKETMYKEEEGRLIRAEGIVLNEVEKIVLDYSNILRIDHLWILENLKTLILNNNYIAKIENLELLIHLEYLDLSFNKISVIEGLETLVNLNTLSLYNNNISTIENLDMLQKLEILSIGKNQIAEWQNVLYLRKLGSLKSLNIDENPCSDEENFRLYVICFLPNLLYYRYQLVSSLEQELGMEIFRQEYNTLQLNETEEKKKKAKEAQLQADLILHAKSFVENMNSNQLFAALFEEDSDGQLFIKLSDEVKDLTDEYEAKMVEVCRKIFHLGQSQYQLRQVEDEQYHICVDRAKLDSQKKSTEHTEAFLKVKTETFSNLRDCQDQFFTGVVAPEDYNNVMQKQMENYNFHLHKMWQELMKCELNLFDQMLDVNDVFERTLAEMINTFIEACQGLFTQIRELTVTYNDDVSESMRKLQMIIPENEVNPDFELIRDKDALINALAASHDVHLLIIDTREDTLIKNSRGWLENLISELQSFEVNRNRDTIKEINNFVEVQGNEFENVANELDTLMANQSVILPIL